MKTAKTYILDIREKYNLEKSIGKLKHNLYEPSPGDVHKICLRLIDEGLQKDDNKTIYNFFDLKPGETLREKVKKQDIDVFRPVCNFLKGKTEAVKDVDTTELIALLVDFNPRPYNKYRSKNLVNRSSQNIDSHEEVKVSDDGNDIPVLKGKRKSKNILIAFATLIAGNLAYIGFTNEKECMLWRDSYFEKCECTGQALEFELNETELKKFRKEEVCDTTTFFIKYEPVIWYDKYNGKIEFFTYYGKNPINGRTLKPITQTIIDNHVEPCDSKEESQDL